MIHLESVTMTHALGGTAQKTVLKPTTITLPTDRKLVVLGPDLLAKSAFMRLLAGIEAPPQGRIRLGVRLSPVIKYLALFHPRLSFLENVDFVANLLNVSLGDLALLLEASGYSDLSRSESQQHSEREHRIAAEVALLTLLPFDCYLADEIGHFPEAIRAQLFDSIDKRKVGIIFACAQPRLARQYADCAIVMRDGLVYPFPNVEEALGFHGR